MRLAAGRGEVLDLGVVAGDPVGDVLERVERRRDLDSVVEATESSVNAAHPLRTTEPSRAAAVAATASLFMRTILSQFENDCQTA